MARLPSGTLTFLFADIEGSTHLLQRLGDRYAVVLTEYRRLFRTILQNHAGHEVDVQGDMVFAAFPRAKDAVSTAIDVQRAIAGYVWLEGAVLRVRMGLHTGEPVSTETGYVGVDVHRTARICAIGHGGQVLLSETTRVLVEDDLPPGTTLRDLGAHRLKDLAHPQRLFQVIVTDLAADFPPLKSLGSLPNNLPIQLTSFIGREMEIAEVKGLLSRARLLTLTGTGGSGKTRLALQVAAEVLEQYSDGVWWVELAALSDPALVPQTVASVLGVPEQPSRPVRETLVGYLRPKSLLLILDNCEHLLDPCARLGETLLRLCPSLTILATSREALAVSGEIIWPVPSLSLPDPQRLPPPDHLPQYEAVRLFIERAVSSQPRFTVTGNNAPAVAQVCHRLDGVPLAIELAAARVRVLAVEQIAARLDDRFRLLTGGSRTVLPRHQTLEAAMDWSYDLLSEQECSLFNRLSVFAGGWTLEAAEVVCSGDGVDTADVLDLLTQLVGKSLVVMETQGGEAWFRLLETVRQYARDRLRKAGEAANVRVRHRDWYLGLAERVEPELQGPRQTVWLERLEREHDNLRAALDWSKAAADGAEAGLRLAGALYWFWWMHGHWSEGRGWLEGALTRSEDVPISALPKALQGAANFAWRQGDYGRATVLSEKGLAICRELGDREHSAWLLMNLGIVALHQGDFGRATALFEESLVLGRELGYKGLISQALAQLGHVARIQYDYTQAAAFFQESLALSREVGNTRLIAYCLRSLGTLALRQKDYERAAVLYKEGLTLCREVRDRWVIEECLEGLAGVACAQENYKQAARLFGSAEALREILGLRRLSADITAHDQLVSATRAGLGDAAFPAAWAEGRAMALERAIEYALFDS